MVLAAGYGTRLGPLTQLRPKPMLPVSGVPLVRWAVQWLAHHGVRDVVVNLHHLGEQIEAELGDGSELGVAIDYSPEHGLILGTGGGLRQARRWLDKGDGEPIVIVNAKIMLDLDLSAVLRAHRSRGAEATMVLRPDPNAERWGSLRLADDGRVVELLKLRHPNAADVEPGPHLMFTGVHIVQPSFLDRIPPQGEQCVIRTAYRSLFDEGTALYGYQHDGYWFEHSTPERYLQGVGNVLAGRVDPPHATGPVRGVDAGAHVHPEATIVGDNFIDAGARVEAGATIGPGVQLGANAVVAAGVTVRDAIVWDGVSVTEDLQRAILPATGAEPVRP